MTSSLPALPRPGMPITASQVELIESSIAERVGEIDDVTALQEWRASASALESYLRSKELQRPMLGAQRRIEARIGQLLTPQQGKKLPTHAEEVSRDGDRTDFRVLAQGFDCLNAEEWRKSRRALVSLLRQKLKLIPPTPPLPDGQFRCIVADPPWRLDTGPDVFNGSGERGHDALEYEQMSLDDIAALPVEERAAEDAHLYLWTTNRYIEAAYGIARAWGFKPSVMLVWAKTPRGIGLGDTFRMTTEFLLYARRGKLKENRIIETTWFNWSRGRHSEKPKAFYELVESVNHAPYLEMFAREQREGWTSWGNEVAAPLFTKEASVDAPETLQ